MTTPTKQHDSGANSQTSERERLANHIAEFGTLGAPQWWTRKAAAQLRADERLDAEIAALRAENEALRTVTGEDVKRAERAYLHDVTYNVEGAMPNMRAALESFIRSKESRRG